MKALPECPCCGVAAGLWWAGEADSPMCLGCGVVLPTPDDPIADIGDRLARATAPTLPEVTT